MNQMPIDFIIHHEFQTDRPAGMTLRAYAEQMRREFREYDRRMREARALHAEAVLEEIRHRSFVPSTITEVARG